MVNVAGAAQSEEHSTSARGRRDDPQHVGMAGGEAPQHEGRHAAALLVEQCPAAGLPGAPVRPG